jgi:catalase
VERIAEQAVDALNDLYGRHPGYRAAHAKGTLCKGTFVATGEAAALTRAAHMQGQPVEVTVRFSNGAGNPNLSDRAPDGRGMATKFYLPDGSRTDIVSLSLPCFFVRTPEAFLEFTRANKPDIGRAWRLPLFLAKHPEALRALRAAVTTKRPSSYAAVRYNSIHSFKWTDAAGAERYVRYTWVPEQDGGPQPDQSDRDYLQKEIGERLARGPVRFTLMLTLAAEGDQVDDPTIPWPQERETVVAGTLELTELETGRETGDDVLVFDPTRVTDGIECSADPLLRLRSEAYSVSVERRSGIPRPG